MSSLSAQDIFDQLPAGLAEVICADMDAAVRYGGHAPNCVNSVGVHIRDLIQMARQGSTGPLTPSQQQRLHVSVWEWCSSTAKGEQP